ncbi:MAG: succinate dehydrogenase flavoprotein subunit [Candidatus Sericytochromatia bacterium]|nr:MAG: succinate dehydrogenase flavoprotein subunit [Candidatus Sericytochromatia bacterium]
MNLDSKIPSGRLQDKWDNYKNNIKLVNPNNKRKHAIIVVGTGLAGASASASLAELGYNVKTFTILDSPRRAHSIAAQGGINAAKNYPNDGDSIWRLFYDTIKGGDYRSREANVYRLAQISSNIIDHCVAQGVPFAREYGGLLDNRSFGGAQLSRTFYARGQTGQQLLLGAYSSLMRQVELKKVTLFNRREMLDLIVIDGKARGILTRNLVTGELERHVGDAVLLCTGGYGNVFYLSTNAKNSNATAAWRCHKKGALFANPCYTQIHPTCIPVSGDYQSKLTLMSESLRNDGRVWVPKKPNDKRHPNEIPEDERDYYLERKYPSFGNLVPRDIASRNAKQVCDEGRGVGDTGLAVYLDFADAIKRLGKDVIKARYGNLFDMYERITGENPYEVPMRIYPAVHYTMGGLWVDYELMSTIPGLFVLGEANFSDHGANRLGASALMQGLADGYFIIPYTLGNYIASNTFNKVDTNSDEFKISEENIRREVKKLLSIKGKKTVLDFHRELGHIMWDYVGMSRNKQGLEKAIKDIQSLKEEFWNNVYVPGDDNNLNKYLEFAGRVADFIELGELMAKRCFT